MRKNRRATRRGQAKAIDKVKEDNAPVAPLRFTARCARPQRVCECSCICVCVWLKRYKAHTSPWYIAAKLYMAQSSCSTCGCCWPRRGVGGQKIETKSSAKKMYKRHAREGSSLVLMYNTYIYVCYTGIYIAQTRARQQPYSPLTTHSNLIRI